MTILQTSTTPATSIGDDSETRRLEALAALDVLDTPAEEGFDIIARLVRNTLGVKIATVALVDAHRQWFKAAVGVTVNQLPRKGSICDITVQMNEPHIINDATADSRYADRHFVKGPPHLRAYAGVPLTTKEGQNVGTLCAIDDKARTFSQDEIRVLQDLARLAITQLESRRDARMDALTGVLGRRGLRETAEHMFRLARRHGHEFAVIMLDVDHFKSVNDTHGHTIGDGVLTELARRTESVLRRTDQVGRMGGEEFAVLLPHTGPAGAMEVAEKIRTAMQDEPFIAGDLNLRVTASLGIASLHAGTSAFDQLLSEADEALYRAKREGRNRIVVHPRPEQAAHVGETRRRVLKAGVIHFNHRMSTIDCTVRLLGPDGAGLDMISTMGVPHDFTLAIRSDEVEIDCHVVTQTERHLDVSFVGKPRKI